MILRREGSQEIKQILNELKKDKNRPAFRRFPNITVAAYPVFPYRPIISTREIYDFAKNNRFLKVRSSAESMSRVAGGIFTQTLAKLDGSAYTYRELNEYGIVYQRFSLLRVSNHFNPDEKWYFMPDQFIRKIGELIHLSQSFYQQCEYSGHIEVKVRLRRIFGEELMLEQGQFPEYIKQQRSYDSEISSSTQYLPRTLMKEEKFIEVVDGLVSQLFWAFNVDAPTNCKIILAVGGLLN